MTGSCTAGRKHWRWTQWWCGGPESWLEVTVLGVTGKIFLCGGAGLEGSKAASRQWQQTHNYKDSEIVWFLLNVWIGNKQ